MHSTQVFFMKFNPVILLCIYWNFKNTQIKNKHQESMNRKVRITSAKYFFMGENFHTFTASTDAITYKNSLHLLFLFLNEFPNAMMATTYSSQKKKNKKIYSNVCLNMKNYLLRFPPLFSILTVHSCFSFYNWNCCMEKYRKPESKKKKTS